MDEETKIYLVQETRYARVVARYYSALLGIYFCTVRKPPPQELEDVIRIGERELSRVNIKRELTNLDSSIIPGQFREIYNHRVDSVLHFHSVDEMASIIEKNPDKKPEGLNIDTILTRLENKIDLLKLAYPDAEDKINEINRTNRLLKIPIDEFRKGRNATHHAYANDLLTLERTKTQGDVSSDVIQHIYNILNMIGVSIFNEIPLPRQIDYFFQLWNEEPLDSLIWCHEDKYISEVEHIVLEAGSFY